jgi:hypothetical protein
MSEKSEKKPGKPDGSAYAAHLAGIAERNVASKKAGRERRQEHERSQAEARYAAEKLQDAGMRREGGGQSSPK